MKNYEKSDAYDLNEATQKTGLTQKELLRLAKKEELSIWIWNNHFYTEDEKHNIIKKPGWFRVLKGNFDTLINDKYMWVDEFLTLEGKRVFPCTIKELEYYQVLYVECPELDLYPEKKEYPEPQETEYKKVTFQIEWENLYFSPEDIQKIKSRTLKEVNEVPCDDVQSQIDKIPEFSTETAQQQDSLEQQLFIGNEDIYHFFRPAPPSTVNYWLKKEDIKKEHLPRRKNNALH